jgi:cold shock CspA family protein
MNTIHIGVVKFFNVGRLYGFITDEARQAKIIFATIMVYPAI